MNNTSLKQILTLVISLVLAFFIIFMVRTVKVSITADTDNSSTSTGQTTTSEATTTKQQETTTAPPETTTKVHEKFQPIRIIFGGNLTISQNLVDSAANYTAISEEASNLLKNADLSMVNLRTCFVDETELSAQISSESYTNPLNISILDALNVNSVSLSNESIMECGSTSLLSTISNLDSKSVLHTGAGGNLSEASKPIICEAYGKKIAILSTCRNIPDMSWIASENTPGVFSSRETESTSAVIRQYKSECDIVIVYINAGDEFSEELDIYQQHMAHAYIDAGADLIVGSFPQSAQGIEYYKNVPIAYSLGNFISGSDENSSIILSVDIQKDNTLVCSITPCVSTIDNISIMDETEKTTFINHLNKLSEDMNGLISEDGKLSPLEE